MTEDRPASAVSECRGEIRMSIRNYYMIVCLREDHELCHECGYPKEFHGDGRTGVQCEQRFASRSDEAWAAYIAMDPDAR